MNHQNLYKLKAPTQSHKSIVQMQRANDRKSLHFENRFQNDCVNSESPPKLTKQQQYYKRFLERQKEKQKEEQKTKIKNVQPNKKQNMKKRLKITVPIDGKGIIPITSKHQPNQSTTAKKSIVKSNKTGKKVLQINVRNSNKVMEKPTKLCQMEKTNLITVEKTLKPVCLDVKNENGLGKAKFSPKKKYGNEKSEVEQNIVSGQNLNVKSEELAKTNDEKILTKIDVEQTQCKKSEYPKSPKNYVSQFPNTSKTKLNVNQVSSIKSTSNQNIGEFIQIQRNEKAANFRMQINMEGNRLHNLVSEWIYYKIINKDSIAIKYINMIDVAIARTRLLISIKFNQFRDLLDEWENNIDIEEVVLEDLEAFWRMVYRQIENCNNRFANLNKLKGNNWIDPEILAEPAVVKKVPKLRKTIATTHYTALELIQKAQMECKIKRDQAKHLCLKATSTPRLKSTRESFNLSPIINSNKPKYVIYRRKYSPSSEESTLKGILKSPNEQKQKNIVISRTNLENDNFLKKKKMQL